MDLLWNEFKLSQPPLFSIPSRNKNFRPEIVKNLLVEFLCFYKAHNELDECAAYCSRLIARRKSSFRRMHGFKSFCKLNAALCRLLRLDIKSVIYNFLGILPETIECTQKRTPLPSQQCFEYILIKLIGLHKLLIRISECCKETAIYFEKLLRYNFFMDIIIFMLSILGRTWKITQKLGLKTAVCYKKLLKYREEFPRHVLSLFAENFEFPHSLESYFTEESKITENIEEITKLSHNDSDDIQMQPHFVLDTLIKEEKVVDTGVVVNRDTLCPLVDIKNFQIKDDVINFINKENKLRKKALEDSWTKNISTEDWKKLIKFFFSNLRKYEEKIAVKKFKMLIKNKI